MSFDQYRLFNYFENVKLLRDEKDTSKNEVHLEDVINSIENGKHLVGKRKVRTILSHHSVPNLLKQKQLIIDNNIRIVNIIRDGRDVILSSNKYVPVERWISCMLQRDMFKDIIDVEVRYEDLVYNSDEVQKILSDTLGLKIKYKFSEYPNHIPKKLFITHVTQNKSRPISDASIGKNLESYKSICSADQLPIFEQYLVKAGY